MISSEFRKTIRRETIISALEEFHKFTTSDFEGDSTTLPFNPNFDTIFLNNHPTIQEILSTLIRNLKEQRDILDE